MSPLSENSEPAANNLLVCRLVQIMLAIYLIPAILIVFLVGIVGFIIAAVARILFRLQGKTTS